MLTKFTLEDIQADLLKAMENPQPDFKIKKIGMPPQNELLPTNFDLVPVNEKFTKNPVFISTEPTVDIWYKQDALFKQPKGIVHMKLYTGDNGFGFFPESSVFAYVWAKVQQDF